MINLVGRAKESKELLTIYNSGRSEFVAVYGRRRVGKTFLIDEVLTGKITFRHAGLSPIDEKNKSNSLSEQLKHFYFSLVFQGMKKSHKPTSWLEAFFMLETWLASKDDGSRQVVFLDELPWMDTPRSGFLTALEAFWNTWACHRHNFMLVVAGSANSWILDNLINNHGGLYGRVTHEIELTPFALFECEKFFESRNIIMSRYDIVQSYMALGGIPYYLAYFEKELSFAQNIDALFFDKKAKLKNEYDRLFSSIFANPEEMKKIVEFLNTRHSGYTRKDISSGVGIPTSGSLSKMLNALIASDFIEKYVPFGMGKRDEHYRLKDPFCIFYLKFIKQNGSGSGMLWATNLDSQNVVVWRGISFENVCMNHIRQIKQALGIAGVSSEQSSWALAGDDYFEGVQIDLLISRKDNIVNLCEMKFYSDEFSVDKSYDRKIARRINVLLEKVSKKTAIHTTLVTTFGLKHNEYFGDFTNVITLDDLFKE